MKFDKDYIYLPHVFLDLIHIGPDEFLKDYKEECLVISSYVDSYKLNPACECRNKIIEFIEENRESSFKFLENWFIKNNQFDYLKDALSPEIIEQKYIVTEVNGKFFEIDDTIEEFFKFKEFFYVS